MTPSSGWRDLELVCPACRGRLSETPAAGKKLASVESRLVCAHCKAVYPVVLDIPDLRTRPDPYIGLEEDRDKGRTLAKECAGLGFTEALEVYYRLTSVVTAAQSSAFIASVLAASGRARETLAGIEGERGLPEGALLDLGCGTAPLAIDAAARYSSVVGVDLAFRWLVMAKFRMETAGVRVPLICACAEALPFPNGAFDRVVGESLIEHVEDQEEALREIARVMPLGADVFLTTPNRFSLGPDPHVGIPAGGFWPNRWIAAYIQKRGGIPPRRTLLSDGALRRLMTGAGFREISIRVPPLAGDRVAALHGPIRWVALAYQTAVRFPPLRLVLRKIGPLLSASAVKPVKLGHVR